MNNLKQIGLRYTTITRRGTASRWGSSTRIGACSQLVAVPVSMVGAGRVPPYLEQVDLFNALKLDFPLAHKPTMAGTVMAVLPGQLHGDGDSGGTVPLPERHTAAGRRLGRRLRLLRRQQDQQRRRDQPQRRVHPGTPQSVASVIDGTSLTAAASEQSLGIAGPYSQPSSTPVPMSRSRQWPASSRAAHRRRLGLAGNGWLLNGLELVGRPLSNALYNHYLTPDANRPDCIVYHNPGWKAARSYHPGGVNLLYCDGHAAFIKDSVNPAAWRAISTRRGRDHLGRCPLKIDARWGIRSRPQIS